MEITQISQMVFHATNSNPFEKSEELWIIHFACTQGLDEKMEMKLINEILRRIKN